MRDYPEKWINAFLVSTTVAETCRIAKISKTKFYQLKHDNDFQGVLRERRDMCIQAAVQALREHFLKGVHILAEIAENPSVSPQVRVNAVSCMLSQLANWETTTDIIERIERLEEPKEDGISTFLGVLDDEGDDY